MTEPTPDDARRFVKTVADIYADATLQLLRAIATRVDRGLDDSAQRSKLGDVLALRTQAQAIARRLSDTRDDVLADTIGRAYDHGVTQGAAHLAEVLGLRDAAADRVAADRLRGTKTSTVNALARALSGQLGALPIVRATMDAFQRAVVAGTVSSAAGVGTRKAAAQRVLDRLALEGIASFTDAAGRRWRMESYAEMATRTTLGQAALQGTVDRIAPTTPFVRVSDVADECERCRPWEGKVLLIVDPSEIPEKWRDVQYDGTLKEARAAGLFHPNCTHSMGAFIPGLTRTNAQRPAKADPQGYADKQEQRRLERGVREWKRRAAVAITPEAKALADAKVQVWEARLAEHTTSAGLVRKSERSSLTRAR